MERLLGRIAQISFGIVAISSALMIIGFFQLLEVFIRFGQGSGLDQNLLFSGATLLPASFIILSLGGLLVLMSFSLWHVMIFKSTQPSPVSKSRLILGWVPPMIFILPLIHFEKLWNARYKGEISGILLLRFWWGSIYVWIGVIVIAIILQIKHIPSLQMLLSLFALASMALFISSLLSIAVLQGFFSVPELRDQEHQ